jgi:hypothetical protein
MIPILDEVVLKYIDQVSRAEPGLRPVDEASRGVAAMSVLRDDWAENRDLLAELSAEFQLPPLRILDILVWAWSGVYDPIWQRSN